MQTVRAILPIVVAIVLVVYMVNQCRKPKGWLGRFFLWEMGGRHSDLTDWGLNRVAIERRHTILDVGCGGGKTSQNSPWSRSKEKSAEWIIPPPVWPLHVEQTGTVSAMVALRFTRLLFLSFPLSTRPSISSRPSRRITIGRTWVRICEKFCAY